MTKAKNQDILLIKASHSQDHTSYSYYFDALLKYFGYYLFVPIYGTISLYDFILGLNRTYHQRHTLMPYHDTPYYQTWDRSLEPSLVLMPCLESIHRLR